MTIAELLARLADAHNKIMWGLSENNTKAAADWLREAEEIRKALETALAEA